MNEKVRASVEHPFHIKRIIWGLISGWTFFTIILLLGLIYIENETTKEMALIEARSSFYKELEFSHWITNLGGVYIPVSGENIKGGKSLKNKNQDLKVNDTLNLTLFKPSAFNNLLGHGLTEQKRAATKITGLNPANNRYKPTKEEKAALLALQNGADEYTSYVNLNGEEKLLFMGKLKARDICLKCHTGYKENDFIGGISVIVPLNPIAAIINKRINIGALGIGLLWLIGIGVIFLGGERLDKQVQQKNNALIGLNQSRNLLLEAQRIADLGSFEWEIKGNKSIGSENFYKILGLSVLKTEGNFEDFLKVIYPDDVEYTREVIQGIIKEQKQVSWDLRAVRPDRSVIFLQAWGQVYLNEVGEPEKVIVSIQDITERRKYEIEIKKLSRAVEQSPSTVVITDTKGNIVYVNSKFVETTGYSVEEAFGKNPRILKSDRFTTEDYKILWDTILSGKEWRGEFHNRKKNGELFWESASISSIKNRFGEITNFIAVKEDITKKKEMEIELNLALEREAESSRLKSTLLANMSHELRTPMNGIIGFTQLLEEEIDDPNQKQMLNNIQESSKRLMTTLNTILDLSELESDKSTLHFENIPILNELIYITGLYKTKAESKGLYINFNCPPEFTAFADTTIFEKIMINLVDNAFKFTFKGGISIYSKDSVEVNGVKYAAICVQDTGIGIEEENLELIFKEFRQASEGYNRSFEGSGLGLTLARKMANLIGGNIIVNSKLNEGSVFTLLLPPAKEDEKPVLVKPETAPRRLQKTSNTPPKILVVEDNEINNDVVRLYLQKDYDIEFTVNGEEALEKTKQIQYDVILMDINLGSGMNGVETTKEIRKMKGYEDIPIVALTGYAMRKDKEKFLHEGMTHYLAKPFDQESITSLMDEIFN